jgi:hypothetical protein
MVSSAVDSAFAMTSDEFDVLNKVLSNQDLGPNKDNIRNVLKWMFMKDGEEPNRQRLNLLKSTSTYSCVLILAAGFLIVTARLGLLARAKDRKDNEEPDGMTVSLLGQLWQGQVRRKRIKVADR